MRKKLIAPANVSTVVFLCITIFNKIPASLIFLGNTYKRFKDANTSNPFNIVSLDFKKASFWLVKFRLTSRIFDAKIFGTSSIIINENKVATVNDQ
ncbi:Uncharacterised protein [Streptococcus pneumoniae]|nr:Uncharacterised protein [Streptococcus pneumoniae]CRF30423.1 Uncharacterised protein [Streptococcus pneumoniae]